MKLARSAASPLMASIPNSRSVEVVGMKPHWLSSQYPLAAHGGDSSNPLKRPMMRCEGDFAAGCRRSESPAFVVGDFANGMRSAPRLMTVGDFATGMRTLSAVALSRGDFATGQRTELSDPPIDAGHRALHGVVRQRRDTLAA
jgi:hypothetical protein